MTPIQNVGESYDTLRVACSVIRGLKQNSSRLVVTRGAAISYQRIPKSWTCIGIRHTDDMPSHGKRLDTGNFQSRVGCFYTHVIPDALSNLLNYCTRFRTMPSSLARQHQI